MQSSLWLAASLCRQAFVLPLSFCVCPQWWRNKISTITGRMWEQGGCKEYYTGDSHWIQRTKQPSSILLFVKRAELRSRHDAITMDIFKLKTIVNMSTVSRTVFKILQYSGENFLSVLSVCNGWMNGLVILILQSKCGNVANPACSPLPCAPVHTYDKCPINSDCVWANRGESWASPILL